MTPWFRYILALTFISLISLALPSQHKFLVFIYCARYIFLGSIPTLSVRAKVIRWLGCAGVRLFDAGTTANYFIELYGFKRTSRPEFSALWRLYRSEVLENVQLLQDCSGTIKLPDADRVLPLSARPASTQSLPGRPAARQAAMTQGLWKNVKSLLEWDIMKASSVPASNEGKKRKLNEHPVSEKRTRPNTHVPPSNSEVSNFGGTRSRAGPLEVTLDQADESKSGPFSQVLPSTSISVPIDTE